LYAICVKAELRNYYFAVIGAYIDKMCAAPSSITRSQWQIMLSDAYHKKCKVLMAMGHYSSAIHFGRLSAVLDTGKFTQKTVDWCLAV